VGGGVGVRRKELLSNIKSSEKKYSLKTIRHYYEFISKVRKYCSSVKLKKSQDSDPDKITC